MSKIEVSKHKRGRRLPRVHVPVDYCVGKAVVTSRLLRTKQGRLIEESFLSQSRPPSRANPTPMSKTWAEARGHFDDIENLSEDNNAGGPGRRSQRDQEYNFDVLEATGRAARHNKHNSKRAKFVKERIYNDIQLMSRSEKDELMAQLARDERKRIFGWPLRGITAELPTRRARRVSTINSNRNTLQSAFGCSNQSRNRTDTITLNMSRIWPIKSTNLTTKCVRGHCAKDDDTEDEDNSKPRGTSMPELPSHVESTLKRSSGTTSGSTGNLLHNVPVVKIALNITGGQVLHEETSTAGMKEVVFQCLQKAEDQINAVKFTDNNQLLDRLTNEENTLISKAHGKRASLYYAYPENNRKSKDPTRSSKTQLAPCTQVAITRRGLNDEESDSRSIDVGNKGYTPKQRLATTNKLEHDPAKLTKSSISKETSCSTIAPFRELRRFQSQHDNSDLAGPQKKRPKVSSKTSCTEVRVFEPRCRNSKDEFGNDRLGIKKIASGEEMMDAHEKHNEAYRNIISVPSPPEGPTWRPYELTDWLIREGSPNNNTEPYYKRKSSTSLQIILRELFFRDCVISVAQMPYDGHVPAHQRTSGPAVCELSSSSSSLTSTKRVQGQALQKSNHDGTQADVSSSSSRYSGDRSLHIPLIDTKGRYPTNIQFIEIQVKTRKYNSPRKAHTTATETGPPLQRRISFAENDNAVYSPPRIKRVTQITRNDIRESIIVGQFDRSFIVLHSQTSDQNLNGSNINGSSAGYLILIDQHALHERILLEQLEDDCLFLRNGELETVGDREDSMKRELRMAPSKVLAPPVTVRVLGVEHVARMRRERMEIARHGFSVKIVNSRSEHSDHPQTRCVAIIRTAPRCLDTGIMTTLRQLTKKLFEEYLAPISHCHAWADNNSNGNNYETFGLVLHKLLRSKACRAAIKCPTQLDRPTLERLIDQMIQCRLPFQCCHGRPTVTPIPLRSLCFDEKEDHNSEIMMPNRAQRLQIAAIRERLDTTRFSATSH
ncbi:uncharacterized protein LOC111251132 isoform X2 [Varroa destructor]|uniref:MutL C-terminal dimerisation domain-containing protein n=1 Tax=Varroa destructor TaxID=109461 RepID=A0A7M7KGC6_VARDE|nr:uncharacterized protein LOC111251132 isoform X2 [Varroa destructor]